MANLGAIGVGVDFGAVYCLFDIALGWDITVNPIRCHEITGAYRPLPRRESWKIVSGTVLDASGNPAAREVRVSVRDTGEVLGRTTSDATTGEYSVSVPVDSQAHAVCLDDAAGTVYNDLILRITPV